MKKHGNSATRAKAKYNMKNYDDVCFRVGIGGNAYINYLAERAGKSKAEYIRSLIIADARKMGENDAQLKIGGGGVIAFKYGLPVLVECKPDTPKQKQLQIEDTTKKSEDIKKARDTLINFLKNRYNVPPSHVNGMLERLIDSFGVPSE